ncbi:hypothetical protein R1flu_017414 [Riccia fluitans]|uniref:Uncharacterized protein n=1 Tax=Riccia fluitans TaxID=41844 RepID=A0ABD1ZE63_9MARC
MKINIQSLIRDDGTRITEGVDIQKETFHFYTDLFAKEVSSGNLQDDSHSQFLKVLERRANRGLLAFMDDMPSYAEFTDILLASPKGRSPGIDGFNMDAFIKLWPIIDKLYVEAMQDCWERVVFPKGFMEGIIILIPKEHNADTLRALRPITLLSTSPHYISFSPRQKIEQKRMSWGGFH